MGDMLGPAATFPDRIVSRGKTEHSTSFLSFFTCLIMSFHLFMLETSEGQTLSPLQ